MGHKALLAAVLLPLAACSGGTNPVTGGSGGSSGGSNASVATLPGTDSPSDSGSIKRYEADDGNGGGYVTGFVYDETSDTFTIDNIAFDGDNTYYREDNATVNANVPYAVYENPSTFTDPNTGASIAQVTNKVIHGRSVNTTRKGDPVTQFVIVRSGSYIGYGFGGFIYERNGGIDLPSTGQAQYTGSYGGIRDFNGQTGLEYTSGDMTLQVDFEDFNDGNGVNGTIVNRRIYDSNGNDITQTYIDALNAEYGTTYTVLPTLIISTGPGTADENGEMEIPIGSYPVTGTGSTVTYESGTFYAVVGGDDGTEVVGVIVIESDSLITEGVTIRETGGFILYQ